MNKQPGGRVAVGVEKLLSCWGKKRRDYKRGRSKHIDAGVADGSLH
jgi:hypothetical protein